MVWLIEGDVIKCAMDPKVEGKETPIFKYNYIKIAIASNARINSIQLNNQLKNKFGTNFTINP